MYETKKKKEYLINYIFSIFNREVNKQLRDENDSLRAIIESNKSNTVTSSPVNKNQTNL